MIGVNQHKKSCWLIGKSREKSFILRVNNNTTSTPQIPHPAPPPGYLSFLRSSSQDSCWLQEFFSTYIRTIGRDQRFPSSIKGDLQVVINKCAQHPLKLCNIHFVVIKSLAALRCGTKRAWGGRYMTQGTLERIPGLCLHPSGPEIDIRV